jgi:hypothetical protein
MTGTNKSFVFFFGDCNRGTNHKGVFIHNNTISIGHYFQIGIDQHLLLFACSGHSKSLDPLWK